MPVRLCSRDPPWKRVFVPLGRVSLRGHISVYSISFFTGSRNLVRLALLSRPDWTAEQ